MAASDKMTVADLRRLAAERGISGVSRMRKADLLQALAAGEAGNGRKRDVVASAVPAKRAAAPSAKARSGKAATTALVRKARPAAKGGKTIATARRDRAVPTTEVDAPEIVETPPESASIWEVTAAKYNLNVGPAIPDEDLGTLPGSYGEDRLVLVPRDPEWVFIYWELSDASYRRALALVPGGRVVLRLYVEQESGHTGVSEQDVGAGSRRVYARARGGDRAMMAELGLRGRGDVFVTMVRSDRTSIPVARVRPGTPRFMSVPFDVPLRTLREQGHVAGGRFVDTRGRLLGEAEFHRLFGRAVPGSRPR